MAIRLRMVDGHWIALCAAETTLRLGDIYLDDVMHHALSEKFRADFVKMGFIKPTEVEEKEEGGNSTDFEYTGDIPKKEE